MAHTLLDGGFGGYPDSWDYVLSMDKHSTAPVTAGEEGITPDLDDTLAYPPLYLHDHGGWLAMDEEADLAFGPMATPPGPLAVPPPTPHVGVVGNLLETFGFDLYDRIILTPQVMDFGNVFNLEQAEVEVWNSHFTAKTLESPIVESGTSGLNLLRPVGAPSEPEVYGALESHVYIVQVTDSGPPVVAASYGFDFTDVSYTKTLLVTGQRVAAWPYECERPFNEILQFKTDVIQAYNGSEQRIAARKFPRQNFQMRYKIFDDNERQRALTSLYGFHGGFFGVPLFHWARNTQQDVIAGDSQLLVDFANADFRESTADKANMLMIWRSPTDYEIARIAVGGLATPGQIDLTSPLSGSHVAGSAAVPLQLCLAKDPLQFKESQTNLIEVGAHWQSKDYYDRADLTSLPVLDGIPIIADKNIIRGKLSQGFKAEYRVFDGGTGDFESYVGRTVPLTQTFLGLEVATEAEAWTLRKILYGLKGRQKTFWAPSYRMDFTVTETIDATDTAITFEENDFHRFAEDAPDPWGAIMIQTLDGTQYFRKITATSAPVAGEETITIAQLGTEVLVPNIVFASLLVRSRLDTDNITIEHLRTGNIKIRMPLAGVKESA